MDAKELEILPEIIRNTSEVAGFGSPASVLQEKVRAIAIAFQPDNMVMWNDLYQAQGAQGIPIGNPTNAFRPPFFQSPSNGLLQSIPQERLHHKVYDWSVECFVRTVRVTRHEDHEEVDQRELVQKLECCSLADLYVQQNQIGLVGLDQSQGFRDFVGFGNEIDYLREILQEDVADMVANVLLVLNEDGFECFHFVQL